MSNNEIMVTVPLDFLLRLTRSEVEASILMEHADKRATSLREENFRMEEENDRLSQSLKRAEGSSTMWFGKYCDIKAQLEALTAREVTQDG